jgi:hypothetical protein
LIKFKCNDTTETQTKITANRVLENEDTRNATSGKRKCGRQIRIAYVRQNTR